YGAVRGGPHRTLRTHVAHRREREQLQFPAGVARRALAGEVGQVQQPDLAVLTRLDAEVWELRGECGRQNQQAAAADVLVRLHRRGPVAWRVAVDGVPATVAHGRVPVGRQRDPALPPDLPGDEGTAVVGATHLEEQVQ